MRARSKLSRPLRIRTVVATRSPFGDAPLVRSAAANDAYFVRVHHSGPLAGGSARRSFAAKAATRDGDVSLPLPDIGSHAERTANASVTERD